MINSIVLKQLEAQGYLQFNNPKNLKLSWITELVQGGATATQIKKCVCIAPGTVYLHSICDHLVGNSHPKCPHVRYAFCTTMYASFLLVTVMPIFKPFYKYTLDDYHILKPSSSQIRHCWTNLLKNSDSFLLSIFSPAELIKVRSKDWSDFTWHHDLQRGVMVLVSSKDHRLCRHTGGNSVWSFGF